MISIGPFSVRVVAVALAALLAWLAARLLPPGRGSAERQRAASLVLDALIAGLVVARIAYVLRWWPEYFARPLAIVSIADGGFYWWAGLPAALLFAAWRTRRLPRVRAPLVGGIAVGMLAWGLAQGGIALANRQAPPLPELALDTLQGNPTELTAWRGEPLVVNLWATWCPPCQREMPALEHAAETHPGVTFLMVNQGENAALIEQFLQRKGLQFDHVLLDHDSAVLEAVGSRGLPTTLFFDADGRLVDSHMGEISAARLSDNLRRHFPSTSRGGS